MKLTNAILKPITIQLLVIEQQITFAHLARNSSLLFSDTFDAWFWTINDNILNHLEKHHEADPNMSTAEAAILYQSMLSHVIPANIYPPKKIQEQITDEILKHIHHEQKRNH